MLRFLFVLSALAERMRRVALTLHTNVHFDQVFTDKWSWLPFVECASVCLGVRVCVRINIKCTIFIFIFIITICYCWFICLNNIFTQIKILCRLVACAPRLNQQRRQRRRRVAVPNINVSANVNVSVDVDVNGGARAFLSLEIYYIFLT